MVTEETVEPASLPVTGQTTRAAYGGITLSSSLGHPAQPATWDDGWSWDSFPQVGSVRVLQKVQECIP